MPTQLTLRILAGTLLAANFVVAQPSEWRRQAFLDATGNGSLSFDRARGRLVSYVHGRAGGDLWELGSGTWTLRATAGPRVASYPGDTAYDEDRREVVHVTVGETWLWNGVAWRQATLSKPMPTALGITMPMAYDAARRTLVLVDENSATWGWDGTDWQLLGNAGPPARRRTALAYDRARQRVVLFSGYLAAGRSLRDTWEWDGTRWTERRPTTSPPERHFHAMAYDDARGVVVLFGGADNRFQLRGDTWEWDGTEWRERPTAVAPTPRRNPRLAYDDRRRRVVLFESPSGPGTCSGRQNCYEERHWEWDGAEWTKRITAALPPAIVSIAQDVARRRVVALGARYPGALQQRTWVWDGFGWSPAPSGVEPTGVPVLCTNAQGQGVLHYDGTETWTLDGGEWQRHSLASAPRSRDRHQMAFDPTTGLVVMFGGRTPAGTPLGDTWEWNGSQWRARSPTTPPPPTHSAAMAYDPQLGGVLLVIPSGATWLWANGSWRLVDASSLPSTRQEDVAMFDEARGQPVLVSRYDSPFVADDTLAWNGQRWQPVQPSGFVHSQTIQRLTTLAFDPVRNRLMSSHAAPDVWFLGAGALATHTAYGGGCGQAPPILAWFGEPAFAREEFAIDIVRAAANQPALFLLGPLTASIPWPTGTNCTLLVDPRAGGAVVAPAITNAHGFASISTSIPTRTSLLGAPLTTQGIVLDPASAGGLAMTGGIHGTLGF